MIRATIAYAAGSDRSKGCWVPGPILPLYKKGQRISVTFPSLPLKPKEILFDLYFSFHAGFLFIVDDEIKIGGARRVTDGAVGYMMRATWHEYLP